MSCSPPDLKILIASTPKTGNTWLRHLLAAIYDLPTVNLGFPFDSDAASALGERWIMHQHYAPEPALLDWARRNNAILITTIRHPGDVFLSLYHYVNSYHERLDFYQLGELAEDDGSFGAPVRSVIQTFFKELLAISAAWKASGVAHVVEYEALHFDPLAALTTLTDAIHPVSRDSIERAIERCDIREMRAMAYENRGFFRQGGYGGWRQVLPADIIDLLRTTDPYPAQFAALGYTLDAEDKWSGAAVRRPPAKADFFEQFGHSPAATSLLKTIYLSFDSGEARRRWPDVASAPDAFYCWLNQPADAAPVARQATPVITNLAAHMHRLRPHLRVDYPDPFGRDRVDFAFWFLENAAREYQLDPLFITPMRESFMEWVTIDWANQPDASDPALASAGAAEQAGVPVLTNLAAYVYRQRPDLQAVFRDLYGEHRIELVRWFIAHAEPEYHFDPAYIAPLRQAFMAWAVLPDAHDPAAASGASLHAGVPVLSNLATYFYRQRPDLQAGLPDLYGQHRVDIVRWFIQHAAREYDLDRACIEPLRQAFMAWAARPDARDPARTANGRASVPVLTNFAAYVYHSRPDLRATFADLYGRHRVDFLLWLIEHASHEYQLDDACIAPLRRQFLDWALQSPSRRSRDRYSKRRFIYLSRYLLAHKQLAHTPGGALIQLVSRLLSRA